MRVWGWAHVCAVAQIMHARVSGSDVYYRQGCHDVYVIVCVLHFDAVMCTCAAVVAVCRERW